MTRGQMQDLLIQFAAEDSDYRDALLQDPRTVVQKQFNNEIPPDVEVKAVEESADTFYVVVPHVAEEGELEDADLEQVAGGLGDKYEANCGGGVLNTLNQVEL